ncbi:hypothetical protein GE061_010241 [Apolygus lucorum]|uniref:Ionotropic glutamate receptor C-terminal domain-containing protein n=1 Tax=Apolygus lucorum TaxID=248454 RepID=A0A8S9Y2P1_APOLU|nr:hypothetical protein GE061_010241 [Apolygus lucorum]
MRTVTGQLSIAVLLIPLLQFAVGTSILDWSPQMVVKYFSARNVHLVDAIVCSENDKTNLFKYFSVASREYGYDGLFRTINCLDENQSEMDTRSGIFIDLSCPSSHQLLLNTTSDKWFTNSFIWFIWDNGTFLEMLTEILPISTFSDVTIATPNGDVSNRFMFGTTLHLAYLYNFTLELVIANNWGDRLENGTWTGMLGLVQQNEVDITLTAMLPLSRRLDISYPTVPTLPYWMAIIFKQPRALGTYKAMVLELSLSTWGCVGATIVIGAVVFALTQKYEPDSDVSYDSEASFTLGAVQSVGIISSQGLSVTPKGTSSRIVCLFLLLLGLLISNYYSAATMTALLSESPPVIKNLEQLIASKPTLTALNISITFMLAAENALTICDLKNGVQSILNGSSFLGEYFVLFNAINTHLQSDVICDLTVFNAGFYSNTINFVKKDPHFRELHIRGILRTLEHGLMQKERQKWIAQRAICSRVTEFIHVQLEAVSVALGVFGLGIFTSFLLLLLEIFLARRARLRKNCDIEPLAKTLINPKRTPSSSS